MKSMLTVVLLFSLIVCCSSRKYQTKKEERPFEEYELGPYDQFWERELEAAENIELYSKSPKDQLRYAKHAASDGDYRIAMATYFKLYKNGTVDSAIREEALFRLGKSHANILNLYKNYEMAIYLLEKLLSEFPETKFRVEAEQSMKTIHKLMKHQN